jgi:ABC-type Zn uptake system ZnuABC Zn-binding protein ZnuA
MKAIIRNNLFRTVLIAGIVASSLSLAAVEFAGCGGAGTREGKLKVAAEIVPLADFCRNVGGDLVKVETMVPSGSSPHAYELTTGQMRFLSEADVLVTTGLGLTPWAEGVFDKLDNPHLVTVTAGEAVPSAELVPAAVENVDAAEGGQERIVYDPHVWLDPNLAVYIIEAVRDGFISADPANASSYQDNADAYIGKLRDLDSWIGGEVANFEEKKFVSFHSSWTYFARRYGLEQVGVIEELPGKEPGAGEMADLIDLIRDKGVRAVFAEPQFNPQAAEAIAEESGVAVTLEILDPLGDTGNPETDTYLEMMRHDVGVMGEVLR